MRFDISGLLDELRAADRQALERIDSSKSPGPLAPTIFASAVECLEERGAPDESWPVWGALLTVALAVAALPRRADHHSLILELAELTGRNEDGTYVAQILLDHVDASDVWLVEAAAGALPGGKSKGLAVRLEAGRAIGILGLIGHPSIVQFLLPLARRNSPRLAPDAALALARAGIWEADEAIVAQLRARPNPESIEAAGLLRCEEAGPILFDLIEPENICRGRTTPAWLPAASTALAGIAGAEAIPPLRRAMETLSPDEDSIICVATDLARLEDGHAIQWLEEQVAGWRESRVYWGKEPLGAKWEAANCLALRGHPGGQALARRWYGYHDRSIAFTADSRAVGDRENSLRALGRAGDESHLPFLEWVLATDHQQGEKGWALAADAERAIARIRNRAARLGSARPRP